MNSTDYEEIVAKAETAALWEKYKDLEKMHLDLMIKEHDEKNVAAWVTTVLFTSTVIFALLWWFKL